MLASLETYLVKDIATALRSRLGFNFPPPRRTVAHPEQIAVADQGAADTDVQIRGQIPSNA